MSTQPDPVECRECSAIFSRFCDDPPDFDYVELCEKHSACARALDGLDPEALPALIEAAKAMFSPMRTDCNERRCGACAMCRLNAALAALGVRQ